ncbi:hypothetical protein SH501x_001152 [Pirellulaceae bacterium SH501]
MIPFQYAVSFICLVTCITGCGKTTDDELSSAATSASINEPPSALSAQENLQVKLKTVFYRGGIVKFSIPESWVEEYEPTGGATFYEDSKDSGTLRLNVLEFKSEGSSETMIQDLIHNQHYEPIQEDLAILRETKSTIEEGESLDIYSWNVAAPVPPNSIRLAVFSYTILQSQSSEPSFQREIELLGNSFRDAEYSKDAGVSGDYTPE